MNVLIWHVHGSWTTALVQGDHAYLLPVLPGRPAEGRGRAETWDWPSGAREVAPHEMADEPVDVVVVQRPVDLELASAWLGGRIPGRDVPLVWLEHNTPPGPCVGNRHPSADLDDVDVVVHVTHTNRLLWDTGSRRTTVIEHGVVDPGLRFDGRWPSAAAVINEPARRGRAVGADLLPWFAEHAAVELYGMGTDQLAGVPGLSVVGNLDQAAMHERLGHHRAYLHPFRWTSLGLSLIEAMTLGLPVVALSTTEVPEAVPPGAGVVSNDLDRLADGLRLFLGDPEAAAAAGRVGRAAALDRYGLDRFLHDWDLLFKELTT